MKNYFIQNFDGANICIIDNQNTAATTSILFLHGSNMNSDIFKHQFDSPLLQKYHLVAINLPGNGKSPKANQPEEVYTFKGLVKTIDHCLTKLHLHNPYAVGHSLGSHLVMNNINSPTIFSGALCLGYPPLHTIADFNRAAIISNSFLYLLSENLTPEQMKEIANDLLSDKKSYIDIVSILSAIEPEFRKIYGKSIADGIVCDEFETIHRFKNPIALIHAEKDRFVKYEYLKEAETELSNCWKSEVILLHNASHIPFIDEAEVINTLLDKYIGETSN